MKKLLLFCIVVGLGCVGSAQRVFYLYLQTDDQSPFYVRMADKIYSSSTAGYLIIPNLRDSNYQFGLGFAKSTKPETRFAITINQNDKGYLVKNFSEEFSLFDLQDLSIVKAVSSNKNNVVYETKTDKFSSVLSKAADDPGLLRVPVAKKEEPKAVNEEKKEALVVNKEEPKVPNNVSKDTLVISANVTAPPANNTKKEVQVETVTEPKTTVQTATEPDKQPATNEKISTTEFQISEYKPSKIVRRSESSTTEGFGVVFLDKMENKIDTIRILIPASKVKIDADAQTVSLSEIGKRNVNPTAESAPEKIDQKIDVDSSAFITKEEVRSKNEVAASSVNCKSNASEKDFMKLRKNMAAKENDEAMIEEAKKIFRNKCFSVEQLRYLSTLFLTSAAKYQFFDASYNYVSDRSNFSSLQSEIKDEYYLKRFKALIGE